MSALVEVRGIVSPVEKEFTAIAPAGISWVKEAEFAMQIVSGSTFLVECARSNPSALQNAVINVAAIGLSLNPALKLAYLVPRKGKICLDISYIGLINLATDSGAVSWVQAELVYEKDAFQMLGAGKPVVHQFDPFSDRGAIKGAYCTAKLSDGDYLVSAMSIQELYAIRDRSEAWAKKQDGPWRTDPGEMMKKTIIKRASKLWPKSERVQQAIDVVNEHEGIDFSVLATAAAPSEGKLTTLRDLLVTKGKDEGAMLKYINQQFKVGAQTINDLSADQVDHAIGLLSGGAK